MVPVGAWPVLSSPAGMTEVPDRKAAWRSASQGALGPWRHGRLRCFDNQGGEMGSGPTVAPVVQAGMCRLFCNLLELKENKENRWCGLLAV